MADCHVEAFPSCPLKGLSRRPYDHDCGGERQPRILTWKIASPWRDFNPPKNGNTTLGSAQPSATGGATGERGKRCAFVTSARVRSGRERSARSGPDASELESDAKVQLAKPHVSASERERETEGPARPADPQGIGLKAETGEQCPSRVHSPNTYVEFTPSASSKLSGSVLVERIQAGERAQERDVGGQDRVPRARTRPRPARCRGCSEARWPARSPRPPLA